MGESEIREVGSSTECLSGGSSVYKANVTESNRSKKNFVINFGRDFCGTLALDEPTRSESTTKRRGSAGVLVWRFW